MWWLETLPALQRLMEEYRSFEFDGENLPVRVLASHYVAFCRDKFARPEFFCWPSAWMVGPKTSEDIQTLWLRHLSLFTDRHDKPGVYPRTWPGRDDAVVHDTFKRFYGSMALYDLTRQWILMDGPFDCNFEWISENYSQERADAWADDTLQQVYGASRADFTLVS